MVPQGLNSLSSVKSTKTDFTFFFKTSLPPFEFHPTKSKTIYFVSKLSFLASKLSEILLKGWKLSEKCLSCPNFHPGLEKEARVKKSEQLGDGGGQ